MSTKKKKSKKKKYAKVPSSLKKSFPAALGKKGSKLIPEKLPSAFSSERMNRAISRIMNEKEFNSKKEADEFLQKHILGKDLKEIEDMAGTGPEEYAQELAYEAIETSDPQEALALAREAIELDPNCIDAHMLITDLTFSSVTEALTRVKKIISQAEKNLGKEYFEENKGHFWGLLETRPYMRARAALIELLWEQREYGEAIDHAEDMLELNPGDNQGIRDTLLGLYLETGNLESARTLFKKFPPEVLAVFLWGHVLERYLSDDLKEAEKILSKAKKRNPFVFDYLAGKKLPGPEALSSFILGEESEAIHCFYNIGTAWQAHPDAVEWLKKMGT
jgi:tetratricopeptide (TPR) repeat protein